MPGNISKQQSKRAYLKLLHLAHLHPTARIVSDGNGGGWGTLSKVEYCKLTSEEIIELYFD